MPEQNVAVVDIGSNTIHLLVAAVDNGVLRPLLDESVPVRLGGDVDKNGEISEQKISNTVEVIADFITKSTMLGSPPPTLVATAAVRDARNAEEFAEAINDASGLDLQILTTEQEAYLAMVGASQANNEGLQLLLDVGGGSSQVIFGNRGTMLRFASITSGAGKLTHKFLKKDPPTDEEMERLQAFLSDEVDPQLPPAPGRVAVALIGGGAARRLPALLNLPAEDTFSIDTLSTAIGLLRNMPAEQVLSAYGLDQERAKMMLPGIMLMRQIMRAYDVQSFRLAPGSIREGAALLISAGLPLTPPKQSPVLSEDERFSEEELSLRKPSLYLNRELSWLEFNARVLEEAADKRHPLLERVKFLAIFNSNLDEFFMVRVSGLREQVKAGIGEPSPDGMTPAEELVEVRERILTISNEEATPLREELMQALEAQNINIADYESLATEQKNALHEYFEAEVFPVCTPLAVDPGHPFPHISNLSLNLAVVLQHPDGGRRFARVKVPNVLPRLVRVPPKNGEITDGRTPRISLVWLEQVLAANLSMLFPMMDIVEVHPFRVIRDADIEIQELEAADLLETVEASLNRRRFGSVVVLFHNPSMPNDLRQILRNNLQIDETDCYVVEGPLGLNDLMEIYRLDRADLKDMPFTAKVAAPLRAPGDNFDLMAQNDILLHHPFDSFSSVVDFISCAADDPNVLAIKQTLYRVGSHSPIVEALLRAAEAGKQVAVLVELKARFDEENNIEWARALEQAGVHVTYGLIGLKTHCKVALVVRKERGGLKRYVHFGTGNYNPATARLYTDLGILSARPELGADATELFNFLTGYSKQTKYRKLLIAPVNLREGIIERIRREVESHRSGQHGIGRVIFKMNSLVDPQMIEELYKASQAGVQVDLIVRGICCLRPGVPGVSENIYVRSIVGRFLEHSRIFYFRNGGDEEVYIGSADLMPRNLNNRVEVLAPISNPQMREHILTEVLELYLRDNVTARVLQSDGTYKRLSPGPDEPAVDVQSTLMMRSLAQPESAPPEVAPGAGRNQSPYGRVDPRD